MRRGERIRASTYLEESNVQSPTSSVYSQVPYNHTLLRSHYDRVRADFGRWTLDFGPKPLDSYPRFLLQIELA